MLPGFVPLGAAQARHRNYAEAESDESILVLRPAKPFSNS